MNIMSTATWLRWLRSGFQNDRTVRQPCARRSAVAARRRSLQVRLELLEERTLLDSSNPLSLTQIATAYQTSGFSGASQWGYIQVVNTVFSARSFTNHQDLYYIQQEVDFTNFESADKGTWAAAIGNYAPTSIGGLNPLTLQPSPQSNPGTTTLTNSVSNTISGSIGWNESQGFNASVGFSVTVANTTSTTVPPIEIAYSGNPKIGSTQWVYTQPGSINNEQTTTLYQQWIWVVPFAQEQNSPDISFQTEAGLSYNSSGAPVPNVTLDMSTIIPLPFGSTFTLTKPNVTGVSPMTVQPGDLFTIEGTGLYPSLIQNVFIGGQPVNMANVVPISDTEIEILAPNTPRNRPQSVVVRTNLGFSNNNVKIIIQNLSSRASGEGGRQHLSEPERGPRHLRPDTPDRHHPGSDLARLSGLGRR
jgi:hypothetical protein